MENGCLNFAHNTVQKHALFYFVYNLQRICVEIFFSIFFHIFKDFDADNFCPFLSTVLKFFQKKYFLKLFNLLTNYAARHNVFKFLKIFFSKKKIILQFSFLDIFKNVHFGNFDPDFVLGFYRGFLKGIFLKIPFLPIFENILLQCLYNFVERNNPLNLKCVIFCIFFNDFL
jgi:hypothetical protein